MLKRSARALALLTATASLLVACGPGAQPSQPAADPAAPGSLTVYSGREEALVKPLIDKFKEQTKIDVKVRYGDTAELAATIMEEGDKSPADVFFAQDAGALGALAAAGRLNKLPDKYLNQVESRFRSPKGEWVGVSGRARTVVYNTSLLKEADLPDSILGFTDAKWKGKLGWAPTNGSFQAFVTGLRLAVGDAEAAKWLKGIKATGVKDYKNNTGIVDAVGKGEISVGFVNHYYLFRFVKEQGEGFTARNYHPRDGGPGAMINIAGAGILKTAKNSANAEKFVAYLLSQGAQQYFADQTFEYPLIQGITVHPLIKPLNQITTPKLDLGSLADLEGTLKLLRDNGVL